MNFAIMCINSQLLTHRMFNIFKLKSTNTYITTNEEPQLTKKVL